MTNQNQKGISSLIGVIIVIALGVAVIGGVLAYRSWWTQKEEGKPPEIEVPENKIKPTQIIKYFPTEIPSEIKEGSCWTNSLSAQRKDAWRCIIDTIISDPCFIIEGNENLVCNPNPITGEKGFLLKLTEPLPEITATDNFGKGWGWLIELEDRISCGFLTGATGVTDGKRINYGCSDGSYILGDLETGAIWKAEKANLDSNLQIISVESVPVQRVWQ